jgi:hypothetical protein
MEMTNLALFKKTIKVCIDNCENQIFCKIYVNGKPISRMQCVLETDGVLLIGDILPFEKKRDYCKGYASLMMAELLKYSSQIGVHTIHGKLSLVDNNHKGRLHAFYKKHGFEIVEYNTPQGLFFGEIMKKI